MGSRINLIKGINQKNNEQGEVKNFISLVSDKVANLVIQLRGISVDFKHQLKIGNEEKNADIIEDLVEEISKIINTIEENQIIIDDKEIFLGDKKTDFNTIDSILINDKKGMIGDKFSNKTRLINEYKILKGLINGLRTSLEWLPSVQDFENIEIDGIVSENKIKDLQRELSKLRSIIKKQNKILDLIKKIEDKYTKEATDQTIKLQDQTDIIDSINKTQDLLINKHKEIETKLADIIVIENTFVIEKKALENENKELKTLIDKETENLKKGYSFIIENRNKIEKQQKEIGKRQKIIEKKQTKLLKEIGKFLLKLQKAKSLEDDKQAKLEEINQKRKSKESEINLQVDNLVDDLKKGNIESILEVSKKARTGTGKEKTNSLQLFTKIVDDLIKNRKKIKEEISKISDEKIKTLTILVFEKLTHGIYSIDNKLLFIDDYVRKIVEENEKG